MQRDVFMVYNKQDKSLAEYLAFKLSTVGLVAFLETSHLIPGEPRQEGIEAALADCKSCAILIGASPPDSLENELIRVALEKRWTPDGAKYRIIPVFLPNADLSLRNTLPKFLTLNTEVTFENTLDDVRAFDALVSGIRGIEPRPPIRYESKEIPYRGLNAFEVTDADVFFGRERIINNILNDLSGLAQVSNASRFLAITGPSGSGKSSLVRAGVISGIQSGKFPEIQNWITAICTPGATPLENIALKMGKLNGTTQDVSKLHSDVQSMLNHDNTLHLMIQILLQDDPERYFVLVIDQFEEIFSLCGDKKIQEAIINNLLYASSIKGGRTFVIITLRTDFYGRCAEFPHFAEVLSKNQLLIGSMSVDELRLAIEIPALRAGAVFEPGLVDKLLHDIQNQPGRLPLLQYALLELWNRRKGFALTHSAYRETGGISEAINKRAEEVFNSFSDIEKEACKSIFLRLIELLDEGEYVKQSVSLKALIPIAGASLPYEHVIQILSGPTVRLLTIHGTLQIENSLLDITDSVFVELSHEALISSWTRLRNWIEQDRHALKTFSRFRTAAVEWERNNRNKELLFPSFRLTEFKELLSENNIYSPTHLENDFLQASETELNERAAEQLVQTKREQQLFAERKYSLVLRILVVLIACVSFIAILFAISAYHGQKNTEASQMETLSLAYAVEAISEIETRPERAFLLLFASISGNAPYQSPLYLRALYHIFDNMFLTKILTGNSGGVLAIDWKENTNIALGHTDGSVHIWDIETGIELHVLRGHTERITSLSWNPLKNEIVTGSDDQTARVWDVNSGRLLDVLQGHEGGITSVSWDPSGQFILTTSDDWTARIWDTKSGKVLKIFEGHNDGIKDGHWNSDGSQIVTGGADRTVTVWNVADSRMLYRITGFSDIVTSVDWSPNNLHIVSGSLDNTLRIINTLSQSVEYTFTGNPFGITSVEWSPDGMYVATGGVDNSIRIWDISSKNLLRVYPGYKGEVTSVVWSPDGQQIAGGSLDGTIRVWDILNSSIESRFAEHQYAVTSIAWNPRNNILATGSLDNYSILWDVHSKTINNFFQNNDAGITSLAWNPTGEELAIGDLNNKINIWKPSLGAITLSFFHSSPVRVVDWNDKGTALLTAGEDWDISLWNSTNGKLMMNLKGHSAGIVAADWSKDGKQVVSASRDHTFRVWNVETGAELLQIRDNTASFTSIAWSPDGQQIVTGSSDKTVRIWSAIDGTELRTLIGHTAAVTAVDWSSDGQFVASAGQDALVVIWHTKLEYAISALRDQICNIYENNNQRIRAELAALGDVDVCTI